MQDPRNKSELKRTVVLSLFIAPANPPIDGSTNMRKNEVRDEVETLVRWRKDHGSSPLTGDRNVQAGKTSASKTR